MAEDNDSKKSGGAPSTDDMMNALSGIIGGGGPTKAEEATVEAAEPEPEPPEPSVPEEETAAEAAAAAQATAEAKLAEAEAMMAAAKAKLAEAEAARAAAPAKVAKAPKPAAAPAPKPAGGRASTDAVGAVAGSMFMSGADDEPLDDDAGDAGDDDLDDDLDVRKGGGVGTWIGAVATVLILGGVLVFLWILADRRMKELESANVLVDGYVELITLYDVHQEDIKQWRIKEHTTAERAKVPVYGILKIDSEPQFADVHIECMPRDARCNNAGTKEAPRWESHWVLDEETREKRCIRDEDCRECREPAPEELKEPDFDMRALCSIYDAKCQEGHCYLPMRTSTTMQGLFVGTLGGLEAERRYVVRLEKPGWLTQTYEITSKDWTLRVNPSRDDSDRVYLHSFNLEPDPNAPPDIKAKVDEYLKKKLEDQAAMLEEMKKWESSN